MQRLRRLGWLALCLPARLGGWLLAVVATQAVSVSSALLAARALFKFFGGRQRGFRATNEAVPAPEIAFTTDETLAKLEVREKVETTCVIDQTALGEAGAQLRGRLDEIRQRRRALGQCGRKIAGTA